MLKDKGEILKNNSKIKNYLALKSIFIIYSIVENIKFKINSIITYFKYYFNLITFDVMNISIWFSWPAGGGVNTSWLMLAELLTKKWYNVLVDKEYASIIKWDNNFIVVYISNDKPFISNKIDYFVCFDDYSITKNEKVYNLQNIINLKTYPSKYKNVPAFGLALKILWIDIKEWEEILPIFFDWEILETNKSELKKWYELDISFPLFDGKRGGGDFKNTQQLFYWNEIIAKWAMESWLDRYSAYPMTPASTIIDEVAEDPRVTFFQWEDEIAVSMSMLWAKFAWKRAMCGTSGWWFALMTESISFSNQAEIWWVYLLSQRDGPSTWTPTFTGQWDLDFALNASFGETYPIVVAPDTFENAYNLIWKALNRSDIYQHPVIFLVDKQFSETYLSIDLKNLKPEPINRGERVWLPFTKGDAEGRGILEEDNFARYQNTDSGISPYTIPWTENWEFITTSYEHDEYGATNELPEMKKQMIEKRSRKLQTFVQQEFNKDFYWYEIINPNAKKFFVTFWFNRYVLESTKFCPPDKGDKGGCNYWIIIITVLQPLDPRLKQRFTDNENNISELTFVEMNYIWQLQKLISNECNLKSDSREKKIKNIRKIELYPIFQEDIK